MMETLGMPVERQQQFLALFAGTAKAALLTGKPAEHEPALLDALRIASQFDRGGEPDLAELEPFSGERYSAARSFWVEQFRGVAPRDGGWKVLDGGPEARWSAGLDAGWETVLAAYDRVLDGVEGMDGAILVAPDGEEPFPLRARRGRAPEAAGAGARARAVRVVRAHAPADGEGVRRRLSGASGGVRRRVTAGSCSTSAAPGTRSCAASRTSCSRWRTGGSS